MGCSGSSAAAADPPAKADAPADVADPAAGDDSLGAYHGRSAQGSDLTEDADAPNRPAAGSDLSGISATDGLHADDHRRMHERLHKLTELDANTKIPFILVELRGLGHQDGYIEICGKDEYGVYDALDKFLTEGNGGTGWACEKLDAGDMGEDTQVPFCDALYRWDHFIQEDQFGTNNMGLSTMRLVDFMTNTLTWTLGVVNGGNVGAKGEIREQQIIFKAPHPMNIVAEHVMIELRSAGFIEVCGHMEGLYDYLQEAFQAEVQEGHDAFCDKYFTVPHTIFKERGRQGENNLGQLTAKICDDIVEKFPGWSLCTLNGGNYGEKGDHREQQLVFRMDHHPCGSKPHLLVELREAGYVEVCGQDTDGVLDKLDEWLKSSWSCKLVKENGPDAFCDRKYRWKYKDMLHASSDIIEIFHYWGWTMQVCSQGTVRVKGNPDCREQQILFRPGLDTALEEHVEPHMFVELHMGHPNASIPADHTQIMEGQKIRINMVGHLRGAKEDLKKFIVDYLGGDAKGLGEDEWAVDIFLGRGESDNNGGSWTMRICDFMCDRLGWAFIVCNVCNLGETGMYREQQLIFRHEGERRDIPVSKAVSGLIDLDSMKEIGFPDYWTIPQVLQCEEAQAVIPCTRPELKDMQEIFDHTFRRVLTRDRVYEYQVSNNEEMPYRLEILHGFRSENAKLYARYARRYSDYKGGSPLRAKTTEKGRTINGRMKDGEALLFHGTNPSSAMNILKTGFSLNNAGKSTGTMFGYGIYLAECVSKSDEYARDDGMGTYPQQMAMLVCRSLVGDPYVVQKAGDYIQEARDAGKDCVLGDRETSVGTYKEFVFFDEASVIPEYTIIYRRNYDKAKVPGHLGHMIKGTTGTTGRAWQVKLQNGYKNIPFEVNKKLLDAMKRNETTVELIIADQEYVFDLVAKTQTNKASGTKRELRAPMVKP